MTYYFKLVWYKVLITFTDQEISFEILRWFSFDSPG
jgi:hypothetical protein